MNISGLTYSAVENRLLKVEQTLVPIDSYGHVSVKVERMDTATVSEEAKYIQEVSELFKAVEMFQKKKRNKIPELDANITGNVTESLKMLEAIGDFQTRDVNGVLSFLMDGYKDGFEETMRRLGEKLGMGGALAMTDLKAAIEWIKSI